GLTELITCGELDDVSGAVNLTITFTKLPFTIKKDDTLVLICKDHNCTFVKWYNKVLNCHCDLKNTNRQVIITVPQNVPNLTLVGNWSINSKNDDKNYSPKHSCQLNMY
ncbi:hypothetical protein BgiBS90_019327, partial [Biomphalaria glabrata]